MNNEFPDYPFIGQIYWTSDENGDQTEWEYTPSGWVEIKRMAILNMGAINFGEKK